MVHYPQAWTTVFATEKDHRSIVEMCLERSQPLPLEVTMETCYGFLVPTGCSCDQGEWGEVFPNEKTPCEWHFGFESLAHPRNLERIQVLNTDFPNETSLQVLKSGNPKILSSSLPQLTTIIWKDDMTKYADNLFPNPLSLPNLRSITVEGRWTPSFIQVNNLISFTMINPMWGIDAEEFRLFVSNNRSLESLKLCVGIREGPQSVKGPPVELFNLKSLNVDLPRPKVLSNIIRVPAFQRLSSLRISLEDELGDWHTLRATGDGISLSAKSWALDIAENWQHLTGYARPTIRQVSAYDRPVDICPYTDFSAPATALMVDAHTLEFGLSYSACWGEKFWAELKELGPQLKTIRFEVSEKVGPFGRLDDPDCNWSPGCFGIPKRCWGDRSLNNIADLVEHRFKEGRPFSTVERLVISEDERVNQMQDHVWRCFCDSRGIQDYLTSM